MLKLDVRYIKTNKTKLGEVLLLETYPNEVCTYGHQKTNASMFIATFFLITKNKGNPNALQY